MTKRDVLIAAGGFTLNVVIGPAQATPEAMRKAIVDLVGATTPKRGRIRLDIPPLMENGNAVPVTVAVESPMTETDHVTAIHLVNEKNPQPHVISVHLGPRSGKAQIATRIKLAASQTVTALAQMSDGSVWYETASVVVTIAACVEDLN